MDQIKPILSDISREEVLVQAWKKVSSYIRYHNWFADTLDLDATTTDLPKFLKDIASDLEHGRWSTDPLRLIPAPKSQDWFVDDRGRWLPRSGNAGVKIRPLAHVSLRDQVAAAAVMLCLADRVETRQRDPRISGSTGDGAAPVVSFGNRLFCDRLRDGTLQHRWGSTKLYRAFFHDYQAFLRRPEVVAEELQDKGAQAAIIQSDLAQFYDRVSPELLMAKLRSLQNDATEDPFFDLAARVLNWSWHRNDLRAVRDYGRASAVRDFERVTLPQGLVAAGFFANVTLMDFDDALSSLRGTDVAEDVSIEDVSRYVDDLRVVLKVNDDGRSPETIEEDVSNRLSALLEQHAPGLMISSEKTKLAFFRGETRPLLRQSRKMQRIQAAVSGGFDATGGEEIIQAVQSLVRAQERYSSQVGAANSRSLLPIPDVRDETVGRFAAARFRRTYRSLRPLLPEGEITPQPATEADEDDSFRGSELTRSELDDEAQTFALTLIDSWIANPANVRLLRVGLDLWPAPEGLQTVLDLLRPYTTTAGRGRARRVALYCLSEILRAGATETGFVADEEALPAGVDVGAFRSLLVDEAIRLLKLPPVSLPWFLRQQALLLLAAIRPAEAPISARPGRIPETSLYRNMICFLQGRFVGETISDYATQAIIARRSFLTADETWQLVQPSLNDKRLAQIAKRDPGFGAELRSRLGAIDALAFSPEVTDRTSDLTLSEVVLWRGGRPSLRNELGVLSFAVAFLRYALASPPIAPVTPYEVIVDVSNVAAYGMVESVSVTRNLVHEDLRALYTPPPWAREGEQWKHQLGYLIRFILTEDLDFTQRVRTPSWREAERLYRPTQSHWLQRIYGFYNGHDAFGDDWLPYSERAEDFLFALLAWPGCKADSTVLKLGSLEEALALAERLLADARAAVGSSTQTLMLQVSAPLVKLPREGRPLRGCVVQTVIPEPEDFDASDLQLNGAAIRRRHRAHLATALAAVEKMLVLRETHKARSDRLDWLILPELSVHPSDVQTHLIPFARARKTIILAGLTYQQVVPGDPLVNSAIWIIPRMTQDRGLQVAIRRQCKQYLAPMETTFEAAGLIKGFRPVQWLVGYDWSAAAAADPLWLTAAVCYDATDLRLASDLCSRSDVFAIPALNQDVGTFDQMALALHYHMYQLIIVANNGKYGGSNAHVPKRKHHVKQVFHTHGQPQASISFFEIDDIDEMKQRHTVGKAQAPGNVWKYPPAGH